MTWRILLAPLSVKHKRKIVARANPITHIYQNKKANIHLAGFIPASPSICIDLSYCIIVSNRIHAAYFYAFYLLFCFIARF